MTEEAGSAGAVTLGFQEGFQQSGAPTRISNAGPLDYPAEIPIARGDEVDTITEPTLSEYIANGAVKGIRLKETSTGFQVLVTVMWDDSKELVVITQRTKKPRVWSSLDRLVKHLGIYPNLPPIELKMRTANAAGKTRKKA